MEKRKDENFIFFGDESCKILLYGKPKGSFENKEVKKYLNPKRDIQYGRISNKMIKDKNKLKGQKYKIIINLVILINLFIKIFPIHKIHFINFYFSNITLKVKGPGNSQIFCPKDQGFPVYYYPDLIYINEKKKDSVEYSFYFNETENIVKLVWINRINKTEYMFKNCYNILEVDLSEFDNSEVTMMSNMFNGCTSLISINFDKIDTSKLIYIGSMFEKCSSLSSVNLSVFKNAKIKSLRFTFLGCSSLTLLDLSDFDTSEVTYMNNIFDGCTNLEYINMKNFNDAKVSSSDKDDIFQSSSR